MYASRHVAQVSFKTTNFIVGSKGSYLNSFFLSALNPHFFNPPGNEMATSFSSGSFGI